MFISNGKLMKIMRSCLCTKWIFHGKMEHNQTANFRAKVIWEPFLQWKAQFDPTLWKIIPWRIVNYGDYRLLVRVPDFWATLQNCKSIKHEWIFTNNFYDSDSIILWSFTFRGCPKSGHLRYSSWQWQDHVRDFIWLLWFHTIIRI